MEVGDIPGRLGNRDGRVPGGVVMLQTHEEQTCFFIKGDGGSIIRAGWDEG